MDEHHLGYKLLRGVRIDIKTLLTNFEKKGSVRYSAFCEEWQRMKFSLIFCERRTVAELLEFCEEVIHIAKGYLEPPWNFPIRVGALFTLYGLYFKQPIKAAAKIRFTKDEWLHLTQFIEGCKGAKHFDICFVHYKMYLNGAYVFTVVPRATGFERGYRKYELKHATRKSVINETILKRPNIIDNELLQELHKSEQLYEEKKSEILGKKNLEFVDKDFSNTLMTKLNDFYSKIQKEYPVKAIEEVLAAEKTIEEPQPSCSANAMVKNEADLTIQERAIKRIRDKNIKKLMDSVQSVEEVTDSDPNMPLDLPEIV